MLGISLGSEERGKKFFFKCEVYGFDEKDDEGRTVCRIVFSQIR